MVRAPVLVVAVFAAGCGYPTFGFVPNDDVDASEPDANDVGTDATTDVARDAADVRDALADDGADARVDEGIDVVPDATNDTGTADTAPRVDSSVTEVDVGPPDTTVTPTSCATASSTTSGSYTIDPDGAGSGTPFTVYCESSDGGGWTLALKLAGANPTFAYDAALWSNDATLNPTSTDLSLTEAKFRSFSELAVKEVRLTMIDASVARSIVVAAVGSSLKALVSGPTLGTTAGRAQWLSLVADGSLQANCNDEGFDLDYSAAALGPRIRLRIGIVGNQEADCSSPDSFLGFGVGLSTDFYCFPGGVDPGITTGNAAGTACSAPSDKATKTFGYVFVR